MPIGKEGLYFSPDKGVSGSSSSSETSGKKVGLTPEQFQGKIGKEQFVAVYDPVQDAKALVLKQENGDLIILTPQASGEWGTFPITAKDAADDFNLGKQKGIQSSTKETRRGH